MMIGTDQVLNTAYSLTLNLIRLKAIDSIEEGDVALGGFRQSLLNEFEEINSKLDALLHVNMKTAVDNLRTALTHAKSAKTEKDMSMAVEWFNRAIECATQGFHALESFDDVFLCTQIIILSTFYANGYFHGRKIENKQLIADLCKAAFDNLAKKACVKSSLGVVFEGNYCFSTKDRKIAEARTIEVARLKQCLEEMTDQTLYAISTSFDKLNLLNLEYTAHRCCRSDWEFFSSECSVMSLENDGDRVVVSCLDVKQDSSNNLHIHVLQSGEKLQFSMEMETCMCSINGSMMFGTPDGNLSVYWFDRAKKELAPTTKVDVCKGEPILELMAGKRDLYVRTASRILTAPLLSDFKDCFTEFKHSCLSRYLALMSNNVCRAIAEHFEPAEKNSSGSPIITLYLSFVSGIRAMRKATKTTEEVKEIVDKSTPWQITVFRNEFLLSVNRSLTSPYTVTLWKLDNPLKPEKVTTFSTEPHPGQLRCLLCTQDRLFTSTLPPDQFNNRPGRNATRDELDKYVNRELTYVSEWDLSVFDRKGVLSSSGEIQKPVYSVVVPKISPDEMKIITNIAPTIESPIATGTMPVDEGGSSRSSSSVMQKNTIGLQAPEAEVENKDLRRRKPAETAPCLNLNSAKQQPAAEDKSSTAIMVLICIVIFLLIVLIACAVLLIYKN